MTKRFAALLLIGVLLLWSRLRLFCRLLSLYRGRFVWNHLFCSWLRFLNSRSFLLWLLLYCRLNILVFRCLRRIYCRIRLILRSFRLFDLGLGSFFRLFTFFVVFLFCRFF